MKLSTLWQSKEDLQIAYKAELDGRRALQLRKALKAIQAELDTAQELWNEAIQKYGSGDRINPGDPGWNDFVKYVTEAFDTEVDVVWEAVLQPDDFEKISPKQLDALVAVGLMEDEG